jgi:hypothetical protein
MESGVFTFTPEEFQVLEEIDFDETIERPKAIRFYTLNEQVSDAYELLMPRGKDVTRFEKDQVRNDVDRLRDLYDAHVTVLPDTYALREPPVAAAYSWVSPVANTVPTPSYSWEEQWRPLYANLRQPNFIPSLIAALPHRFGTSGAGVPAYAMTAPTEFVTETGTDSGRGLPDYIIPRTRVHEDKTIDILLQPLEGSGDQVGFTGYFLRKRPLDLPNPLAEHPFLTANEDVFLPSSAPLKDIVPSLDAVLTHAIPVSQDPYGASRPFLALWNVQLSSIPWSSWKSTFPPAEIIRTRTAPILFPPSTSTPSGVPEKIQDIYGVPHPSGVSVRRWLMNRMDGGRVVIDLLRSMVSEAGLVNLVPTVDLPRAAYPDTTVEGCSLEGSSFQDFATMGILRRTFVEANKDPYARITYQCVPLEFIKQERAQSGYRNRLAWAEDTGTIMKKTYLMRLAEVTPPTRPVVREAAAPLTPARPESVRRGEILAIQRDEKRYPDDKLKAIRTLLTGTTLTTNLYTDPDGSFVACAHTLALLSGELATNRQLFYDTWTARVSGFRVCRFCGEQLNTDVYEDADEYDEEGFVIRSAEALEVTGPITSGVAEYATGLRLLQPRFMLKTPHDDTVFLVLSLLQVLPTADTLDKFLALGRAVAAVQFKGPDSEKNARFQGATGLATAALLLQCHIPTLVPRRSFGSRPLVLSGYPRDSPSPAREYTIVDTLMMVLRKTFEAFPSTFTGPSKALLKGVISKPGEIKKTVMTLLSAASPLMTSKKVEGKRVEPTFIPAMLKAAKIHVGQAPPVEAPVTLIPVVPPPEEFGTITSFPACPSARPIWSSGRIPSVTDPDIPLRKGGQAARSARQIVPTVSDRAVPTPVEAKVIRARLAGEGTVTSTIPVGTQVRTNLLLASRVADMLRQPTSVRTVDPTQDSEELREIAKGLVVEQLKSLEGKEAIPKAKEFETRRSKDIALYMLQADYVSEKSEANKLRATERLKIVEDMKQKSDTERQLMQQLMSIGIAPYLVTIADRETFAREAQLVQDALRQEADENGRGEADDMPPLEPADTGVGAARDGDADRDPDVRGADHGDYGDRAALREGRDPLETSLGAGGNDRSV